MLYWLMRVNDKYLLTVSEDCIVAVGIVAENKIAGKL